MDSICQKYSKSLKSMISRPTQLTTVSQSIEVPSNQTTTISQSVEVPSNQTTTVSQLIETVSIEIQKLFEIPSIQNNKCSTKKCYTISEFLDNVENPEDIGALFVYQLQNHQQRKSRLTHRL